MKKSFLLVFFFLFLTNIKAQVLLNQSFNVTTATITMPAGWTVSGSGSNAGCNSYNWEQVPSGGFICSSTGPYPNPSAHTGSGMAGFNSWDINYGGYSEMVSPALNFSATGPYIFSFWVYNSSFAYLHDSIRVFVNTAPTSVGASSTMLFGLDPTYSNSTSGWVQYTATIPASYNGPTNYIIFRGYSMYGYDLFFDDVIVQNATPPAPTPVTNNGPVCPFSSIVITATAPTGYPNPTFTLTGPTIGAPIINTTGVFNLPNASAAMAGTYSVIVTSGGFTSTAATTNVVVNGTPTAMFISNNISSSSCLSSNGSFQINNLNPSTTYTVKYRKNGSATPTTVTGAVSSATGTYVVSGLAPASYDSIVVISPAPSNCVSNYVTTAVLITAPNPPANPAVTYSSPVCPNTTLSLVVTNPLSGGTGSYKWTGPAAFTANTANASRANMIASYSGTYTVVDSVFASGCTSQSSVTITMSNPDVRPLAFRKTYCQGDIAAPISAQTTLSGAILTFYDTNKVVVNPAPTPSTLLPGIQRWYVTQTLNCESLYDTVYILVNPVPIAPTVQNARIEYCQYATASPLTASGTNIRWFTTPTGGLGTATAPTPSTLVPGTYFFYASQTTNFPTSSCESGRTMITVVVKPKPQPPAVTSPLNLCQGDAIAPLTAIGQNLLWYTIPNGGVGVPVAPLPNTGYEDSFKYYVTQSVLGCESDRALIAVTVNYKPNGIITGSSPWVCQNGIDSFFYYGNGRANADYNWFGSLRSNIISGLGTPGPVVVRFDTAGTSVIRLTINNKGCISSLISSPITVRPLPKISFVNRQDVCVHDLVTIALNHTESGISGYHWDFGSNDYILEYGVVTTGGPFGVRYPTAGHYTVSATATKDLCTSNPINQEVWVHALPDATITSSKSPVDICSMDTLMLSVKAVEEGGTYVWTPKAYFQDRQDSLNNVVFAVVNQNSEVKVRVRTAYGCEAMDSIAVTTKPCCGVYFPNAFAPDGNVEANKIFRPMTIGFHSVNTFKVINRWGQVVFETKIEKKGWDGTFNGVPQDMGTYYYYISYKCEGKNVEEKGEVLLLR